MYYICGMYIQNCTSKKNGKSYTYPLLCKKYRENGKIKTEVVANLSVFPNDVVLAIRNALRSSDEKELMVSLKDITVEKSIDYGFVFVLITLLERLKIKRALEVILGERSKLVSLMIIGKIVTRGSKLCIYNWIQRNEEVAKRLGIDLGTLKINDLYEVLGDLSYVQGRIERKWNIYHKEQCDEVYLYDITSSYFEGTQNALSNYGYNRDGKKGKNQIVIGLITNKNGFPLSIQVFEGNATDHTTVINQIKKIKQEFGAKSIVFVGDRGMRIRYNPEQMEQCDKEGVSYITGLSIEEIRGLVKEGTIQLNMFSKDLVEVEDDGHRYVLCTNPELEKEHSQTRMMLQSKFEDNVYDIKLSYENRHNKNLINKINLEQGCKNKNPVTTFSDKQSDSYKYRFRKMAEKYNMQSFYQATITNQEFTVNFDFDKYAQSKQLDGKYVFVTNVSKQAMTKEAVRNEYKNLQYMEHAFRDMKTSKLDIRPIYHVNAETTRGHVFVTFFAYAIVRELETKIHPWLKEKNKTQQTQFSIQDMEEELKMIKLNTLNVGNNYQELKITALTNIQKEILALLSIDTANLTL
ncbi:MAG: IS1634 family transposase [Paludibacter sp.]|nr:IS1634 family transposase [Paludibacter sp.]